MRADFPDHIKTEMSSVKCIISTGNAWVWQAHHQNNQLLMTSRNIHRQNYWCRLYEISVFCFGWLGIFPKSALAATKLYMEWQFDPSLTDVARAGSGPGSTTSSFLSKCWLPTALSKFLPHPASDPGLDSVTTQHLLKGVVSSSATSAKWHIISGKWQYPVTLESMLSHTVMLFES